MKKNKIILLLFLCICSMFSVIGQEKSAGFKKGIKELAIELQFYPAGFITSFRAMKQLSPHTAQC